MESFSDRLRAEAAPIWGKIFAHPFLKDIKEGTLPLETFRYYLAQDYLYLEGFARTVAVALSKAPNANLLEELGHRVLTPIERPLHHKLVDAAGMTMEDVRGASPSPTNTGYVNHMLATAARQASSISATSRSCPASWTCTPTRVWSCWPSRATNRRCARA